MSYINHKYFNNIEVSPKNYDVISLIELITDKYLLNNLNEYAKLFHVDFCKSNLYTLNLLIKTQFQ